MLSNPLAAAAPLAGLAAGPQTAGAASPAPGFLDLVSGALADVSATQAQAAGAQAGFAAALPGATLGKALVASDRAEVAWNATVAVRNEVVTAYQSIMNMQF